MNKLNFGDNIDWLRQMRDGSVDLIYLDPPFNSNALYNLIHKSPVGDPTDSQKRAFKDTWRWEEDAASIAMDEVAERDPQVHRLLAALKASLGTSDLMAYLAMMSVRLIELRRVLDDKGSLYLHCDPTASHYLKIVLDAVFGQENFRSEVIWKRTSAHSSAKRWGPVHDTILFYTASKKFTWNKVFQPYDEAYLETFFDMEDANGRRWKRSDLTGAGRRNGETGKPWRGIDVDAKGRHWAYLPTELERLDKTGRVHWPEKDGGVPRLKQYPEDLDGVPAQDIITDIRPLHNLARERLGYQTQKPVALMSRIILASSNVGDVVLDPFCGCGTTIHASELHERQWIGIDVSYDAILVIEDRLKTWLPGATYEVSGIPKSERDAWALAERSKYTFQEWAVGRLGGRSRGRGADRGIDGEIHYMTGRDSYGRGIVSVKGGHSIGPAAVRELAGTVDREAADMGVFVCLKEPTREMKLEAQRSKTVVLPGGTRHKIQIVTAKELVDGPNIGIPTALNTITAAQHARAQLNKRVPRPPTPEELRREPRLPPMPIKGGRGADQAPLPLDEPILVQPRDKGGKRHA